MRVGIIAEGTEDQAVISNILRAFKVDSSDIIEIKPSLQKDVSDENNPDNPTIGTLQGVKNACAGYRGRRYYFEMAFQISEVDFVVVYLDTAEIENQDFAFSKPLKTGNIDYSTELRTQVINLINSWLENNYQNQLLYAIAIEEVEAWLLAIYEKSDTGLSANPKNRLSYILRDRKLDFDELSKDFRKLKKLQTFLSYNQSLRLFVESIEQALSN